MDQQTSNTSWCFPPILSSQVSCLCAPNHYGTDYCEPGCPSELPPSVYVPSKLSTQAGYPFPGVSWTLACNGGYTSSTHPTNATCQADFAWERLPPGAPIAPCAICVCTSFSYMSMTCTSRPLKAFPYTVERYAIMNLRNTSLDSLDVTASYSSVQTLDAGLNRITTIEEATLGNWLGLQILRLDGNPLVAIAPAAMAKCTALVELYLGGCPGLGAQLLAWPVAALAVHPRLRTVDLTAVPFSTGKLPAWVGAIRPLAHLIVPRTNLTAIAPADLHDLANLTKIDLSRNPIVQVAARTWAQVPNLATLQWFVPIAMDAASRCTIETQAPLKIACLCAPGLVTGPAGDQCSRECMDPSAAPELSSALVRSRNCTGRLTDDACDLRCEGDRVSKLVCDEAGAWAFQSGTPCVPVASADASSGSGSGTGVVVGTVVGVLVGVLAVVSVAVLVSRRRRHQASTTVIEMELRSLLTQSVRGVFLRKYGHSVDDTAALDRAFGELEVREDAIVLEREIGRGESGVVYVGRAAGMRRWGASWWPRRERTEGGDGVRARGWKAGMLMAVKFNSEVTPEAQARVLLEARVLHLCGHANILQIIGVVCETMPVRLCTEYMANGDCRTYLRACRPTAVAPRAVLGSSDFFTMAVQVAAAMAFLEQRQIVHRDLAAR